MTRYHTVPDGSDERAALVADLHLQAERIDLGLQDRYIPPRSTLEFEDCRSCHGSGARFFGLAVCLKCGGFGRVSVSA